jgi:glycosyltransferase involved in cell wall biosynthesis
MRILAMTNLYPNPYQPHRATFNRQQFRALAMEHEVRVIAPIAWTAQRNKTLLAADRTRLSDGMIIYHPRYVFTPKILRGWYGQFLVQSIRGCFRRIVSEFSPDIVLGCWAYPDGWAAVQLANEVNLPVAIKVHGSDLLTIDDQPARKQRTVEALSRADAVIAVSRDLANRAVAMGAARTHVVYNGVDTSVFHSGSREDARRQLGLGSPDPLILFVGNLVPVKGLDILIDALALLDKSGQKFQCAIVGTGPQQAELQNRIERLNLNNRVKLAGPRPLEELPLWYQASHLVVLPSRSEGVPNVLLEAAACGRPFVASRVGGIPEIAPSDSLLPPEDPTALADRIRSFLDPNYHPAVDAPFRAGSWNDSARALQNVLSSVVAARGARSLSAG